MILQTGINQYLAALEVVPSGVRTLKDLIAFNEQHGKEELPPGWTEIDASKYAYSTLVHNRPDSDTYLVARLLSLKKHSWMRATIELWNGAGAWPETRVSTPRY